MARIVRRGGMMQAQFDAVLPILHRLQPIIPCEIHTIFVSMDLDKTVAAQITTMEEYRQAHLVLGRDHYDFSYVEQCKDITHEIIHTIVEPMTRASRSCFTILEKEYNLPSVALRVLQEEENRCVERVVCDLTEILFPRLFPEHASY